jgi:hypothetical protein
MLDKLTPTSSITLPKPVEIITGRTIAHSHSWTELKRAKLAAKATFGAVVISPLTVIQAAETFGVPKSAVAEALKKLGVVLRHHNGNGHTAATVPTWDTLSSEQRSTFLRENFDQIWSELEHVTS